jgi:hypothetical protein
MLLWLERGHRLVKGGSIAWSNGRKSRRGTGGQVIGHVPAYPVLRPAFDEYVQTAVRAIAVDLENRISEYWQQSLRRLKRVA